MLGMCPTLAVIIFCRKRTGDGTDNDSCPCHVEYADLHAAEDHSADSARVPSFIVIVASFVTMVQLSAGRIYSESV